MKLDLSFDALLKSQGFSKELMHKLSEDIHHLEKVASSPGQLSHTLKFMLPHLGMALGAAALTGTYGYYAAKKKYEQHADKLKNSFDALLVSNKDYTNNPNQFIQRFSELSLISPTVAGNPALAAKIITPRLDKGFDLDDVHRLSAIEFHTAATPKPADPGAAAQAHAAATLGRAAEIMYPILITQRMVTPMGKEIHQTNQKVKDIAAGTQPPPSKLPEITPDIMAELRRRGGGLNLGHTKKSSAEEQWVSDECLGRMLADRYSMFKTAGIIPAGVKSFGSDVWNKGGKNIGDYVKLMALPLAIGGGIHLVNQLMKMKADKKMDHQADQVFASLKRNNSYVQENPELAAQAFDTLRSFAPALAAKPLVAKTFVEHVITSDGRIPPDTANMLASTQQLVNRLNEATGGGFIEGLKSPMSLFKHTVSAKGDKENK